jgi:indole-3-glycerol phosphate synthase
MHALRLYEKYRDDLQRFSIIAESGLSNSEDLEIYQNEGINKFLIGEGILKGLL